MSYRYTTALSHLILAITGIYCLFQVKASTFTYSHVTFGIIAINSIIGVWRWGNPGYGDKTDGLYKFTSYLQLLFTMPCITTTIWLANAYEKSVSWAWTFASFAPLVLYLSNTSIDIRNNLVEVLTPANLIATMIVSFLTENYYGIATAISYAIDYYYVLKHGANYEIPAQDLYNYGLSFFTYFALKAIGD